MSEEALQGDYHPAEKVQRQNDTNSTGNALSSKRPTVNSHHDKVADEKRPRVVESLIHNTAPQRRTRIGPQYQAKIPPWPPIADNSQSASRQVDNKANASPQADR